jgi:copper chaperone CopZ
MAMIRFSGIILAIVILAGCSQQSSEVSPAAMETTPAAFNVGGAPTVEFSVPDMMCPTSCVAKTKEILSQQPGAKEVRVDFDTKTAVVAIESGSFNADQAIAALVDHGFDHSTVKSEPSGATATPETSSEKPTSSDHSG